MKIPRPNHTPPYPMDKKTVEFVYTGGERNKRRFQMLAKSVRVSISRRHKSLIQTAPMADFTISVSVRPSAVATMVLLCVAICGRFAMCYGVTRTVVMSGIISGSYDVDCGATGVAHGNPNKYVIAFIF